MVLSAMVVSPFCLVEPVFPGCHDELQQLADALAGGTFCACLKAQLAPWRHVVDQRLTRARLLALAQSLVGPAHCRGFSRDVHSLHLMRDIILHSCKYAVLQFILPWGLSGFVDARGPRSF